MSNKSDREKRELELYKQWLKSPEARIVLRNDVEKFKQAPSKEKRNRALTIHCLCREMDEPWPEEIIETLMCVLDNEACRRVPDWRKRKANRQINGFRGNEFWWKVIAFVRSEKAKGLSKESALEKFHSKGKHLSHLGHIEFDTFKEYFYKNTKQG